MRKLLIAVLVVTFSGCATVDKPQLSELMWPEPPLTPRIKFVGILRDQNDLGRSGGELFMEALLGPKKREPDSITRPMGVVTSRDAKRLYVTDYAEARVLVFDFENSRVSRLGDNVQGFKYPFGIAVDEKDNVYVADAGSRLIRVFDRDGKFLRNIIHDELERPAGIAIDSARRRLYVIDPAHLKSHNHTLHMIDIDKGDCLRHFGGVGNEAGKFFFPTNVAVDAQGNVYVTDTFNSRVQVFDPDGRHLKTIGERGDGVGMFDKPKGVALDSFGNIYVVDSSWSNVQIFNQRGQVLLFFGGRGGMPGLLTNPTGIAIDKNNRIYVADAFNGRIGIYQLINTKAEDSLVTLPLQPEKGGGLAKTEIKKEQIGQGAKK